jgi:hypothetical protein
LVAAKVNWQPSSEQTLDTNTLIARNLKFEVMANDATGLDA